VNKNSTPCFPPSAIRTWLLFACICSPCLAQNSSQAPPIAAPQHTISVQQPPFDRLELLAFIAGHWSGPYISVEIRRRGIEFAPDSIFLSAASDAGAGFEIIQALHSTKPSKVQRSAPKRTQAYAILLRAAADLHNGNFTSASAEYRAALNLVPDSATLHLANATNLLILKNYSEAEAEIRTSLRIWPEDAEAHSSLATALGSQVRDAEAVPEAREALRIFPSHKAALIQLGFSLTRSRQYKDAIPVLREAIPRSPEMPLLHKHLGLSLLHTGDINGAIDELTIFLKAEPNDAEGHYELGVALRKKTRHEEAQVHFREASRLEPSNPLYLSLANPGPADKPIDPASPRPDHGSVASSVYSNEFFGFTFIIPKGWRVLEAEAARSLLRAAGDYLAQDDPINKDVFLAAERNSLQLLVIVDDSVTNQGSLRKLLQIIANDLHYQPEIRTGEDFLKVAGQGIRENNLPMEIMGELLPMTIGGRPFWRANVRIQTQTGPHYGTQIATVERGYALSFVINCDDLVVLDQMSKTTQTLHFFKDKK
jgi:Flp pilus assembly protein TadD